MLPSAAPMLLLFARVNRKDKEAGAPLVPIVLFAAGYLLVWGGFCAIATALQWGLESARLLSPMLVTTCFGREVPLAFGASHQVVARPNEWQRQMRSF